MVRGFGRLAWLGALTAGLLFAGCSGSGSGSSGPSASTSGAVLGSGPTPAPAPAATPIQPVAPTFVPVGVNVPSGPLFDLPQGYLAGGGDPVFVPSQIESDSFTDRNPNVVPPLLKMLVWNVEKGLDALAVEQELLAIPELKDADFILLQECPRSDSNSVPAGINLARRLAQTLRMDYVFATEWDFRHARPGGGGNGSAILSKYPLGNVEEIRAKPFLDYWAYFQRLGGPLTLAADAMVGGKMLKIYNTHLMVADLGGGRQRQCREVLDDANRPDRSPFQILAGDLNTWTVNPLWNNSVQPGGEPAVFDIFSEGWINGLAAQSATFTQLGIGFFPQQLDWVFQRNLPTTGAGDVVLNAHASDHLPLFFEFSLQ